MAEWLRRVPAKYMGFPRESSNLSGDVNLFGINFCHFNVILFVPVFGSALSNLIETKYYFWGFASDIFPSPNKSDSGLIAFVGSFFQFTQSKI